ncbi:MAG TPA: bifunctional adenosylcobinamide kinase/adenosylcobinamide-phosphate guanylyltransferase [Propylenella sp.]
MREGVVLVLGGARSGKSAYAERLVTESGLTPVYVATAEAGDAEMAARIAEHRARRGAGWTTVEAPDRLEQILAREAGAGRALLVDCLTLWLSNIMLAGADAEARCRALADAAPRLPGLVVFVSNEVGLGLVPDTPLGRRFRDAQGRLNQAMAAVAAQVVFMAAGLPVVLKGKS